MNEAIRHYTNEFRSRRDVSPYDAEVLFDAMITETDEDPLTDFLSAWATKGATEDELYRFATILRDRMKTIDTKGKTCVDIVGTGGSATKTFNVSTAAAFVVAGAGIPVAKHGNRAATSSSGSADVLALLGIDVDIEPAQAEANLHTHGICFMFAPRHHSLSPTLAGARKRVGAPTIFNCIGPLCNPALAQHQLIGVWDRKLLGPMSRVLLRLGTQHSWLVHGESGLDEIFPFGPTKIVEVAGPETKEFDIGPESPSGIDEDVILRNLSAKDSAALILSILANDQQDLPAEHIVTFNAGAAIHIAGGAASLPEGIHLAQQSIRTGAAKQKLEALRKK